MRLSSDTPTLKQHPRRSGRAGVGAFALALVALVCAVFATAAPRAVAAEGAVLLAPGSQAGGVFTPLTNPQTGEPAPASAITQTTATLNATLNPAGTTLSGCKFEYGTTLSYGASVPCTPSSASGSSPVAVSASIAGLTARTMYHFRIVVTSAGFSSVDETFKTLPNAPTVATKAVSSVTQTTATLNATVNPNGGEVSRCEFEYGETTSYGKMAPCASLPGSGTSAVEVSASISGLAANTTYHFRIVATNGGGMSKGSDETFKTLPNAPTVVTKAASSVTQTTATLNATVNPNGGEVSKCEFEYGETTSFGKTAPCVPAPGSGTTAVPVSASLTGLTANTTYHYKVVATNASGTSEGEETFKTPLNPPTAVTGLPSGKTQTTATVNATVNPNDVEVTQCTFEYGTTTLYGKTAACVPAPGSGSTAVAVSASLTGLTANTTYHFRVLATSAGGTSEGLDASFTTLPSAPTVATGVASSIASTTTIVNATVNPNGGLGTECKFEYGPTTSYGETVSCTSAPGSGGTAVAVSASLTGLTAKSPYHFRVVATNAGGTSEGSDASFTTLPNAPTAVTAVASELTQTTATVSATVNPNEAEVTECTFEYGATNSYGQSTPCAPTPGSGSTAVAVSARLAGLAAGTTYHYRVVAKNAGGPGEGSDETFATLAAAAPPVTPVEIVRNPVTGPSGPPAPVLGQIANAAAVAGQVSVRLPGARTFTSLSSTVRQIPYGTVVEATHGEISITAATAAAGVQTGVFFDGQFMLTQSANGTVLATLTGGDFSVCPPRKGAKSAKRKRKGAKFASPNHLVRRLWGNVSGNFSTKANYAEGLVQGAEWLTEDMCEGTLILATRNHVEVTDLVRHRHVEVGTEQIYISNRSPSARAILNR